MKKSIDLRIRHFNCGDREHMLSKIDALINEANRADEQYPVYLGL
jgi:hypothetical protein